MKRQRAGGIVAPPPAGTADDGWEVLCAGLETLGGALVLLDAAGRVRYLTAAAAQMLGAGAAPVPGQAWAPLWAALGGDEGTLGAEGRRVLLRRGDATLPARAWQRPLAGTPAQLI